MRDLDHTLSWMPSCSYRQLQVGCPVKGWLLKASRLPISLISLVVTRLVEFGMSADFKHCHADINVYAVGMPKPLPGDLRWRIVWQHCYQDEEAEQVAKNLWVQKLFKGSLTEQEVFPHQLNVMVHQGNLVSWQFSIAF